MVTDKKKFCSMQDSLPLAVAVPLSDSLSNTAGWPVLEMVCLSRERYETLIALEAVMKLEESCLGMN